MALSGHAELHRTCPLLWVKRTSGKGRGNFAARVSTVRRSAPGSCRASVAHPRYGEPNPLAGIHKTEVNPTD